MAPALIEAAATVSQSSGRKLNFINTGILDNISNVASSRDTLDRAIVSSCTLEARLTTNPGRNITIKIDDRGLKNHITDREELSRKDISTTEAMDYQNSELSEPSSTLVTKQNEMQLAEQSLLQTEATCALTDADGAKLDPARSQAPAESTPYIALQEKTMKTNEKLQSLDHRAKSLRDRVKEIQANRIITHTQNQAKLIDYSSISLCDPRFKSDLQLNESTISTGHNGTMNDLNRPVTKMKLIDQPSQLVNILQGNDSALRTCPSSQSAPLGTCSPTPPKGTKGDLSLDARKDVFGTLAGHVEAFANLDDPDATDPESDVDDDDIYMGQRDSLHPQISRKKVDRIWTSDRVKIGSMCTWIQAQVADLSHKIKRYGDLYQHAKLSRQQLIFEETRQQLINFGAEKCLSDTVFGNNDLSNDNLQSNIFTKLQVHTNGLAKDLSTQQKTEIKYEKGAGARTIPVAKFPKHKYVKRSIKSEFKSGVASYHCPDLPAPFPCKQCQKACATGFGKTPVNMSAVYLDHSYHGQLSTKYDMQLPHVLESVLRKEKISSGRKSLVPASMKNDIQEKTDSAAVTGLGSTAVAATNAMKMKLDRKRQRRTSKPTGEDSEYEDHPKPKKKAVRLSAASQLQKRASSLRAPSSGSGESRPSTPLTEQSLLSSSYPSPSLAQLVKKKNRPSSEYDINNIVIPYSISSSTRLEKPQYKEILTPAWRPLDRFCQQDDNRREEKQEDTSDEAYIHRHGACEVVEHKRFTSYFQLPIRRSRSSRKSSECNTPEPYSPSNPEYSNSSFNSASTPTEFILATPLSGKLSKQYSAPLPLQLEDNKIIFWPQRTFPLTGDDLCELVNEVQDIREAPPVLAETSKLELDNINEVPNTPLEKDMPVSLSPVDDLMSPCRSPCDEDDEKWTVKLVSDVEPSFKDTGANRKGIVLKLAKK